jgi:hypothetical protein
MKTLKIIFLTSLFFACANLSAFDFMSVFMHSEIAGKNSLFADIGIAPFGFKEPEFSVLPIEARAEYMLPLPLPFSFGLFLKTPYPNFKSFGARIGYHFNISALNRLTDLYAVYSFDFGFLRKKIMEEYGDTPAPLRWYDFRFGARHYFKSRYGVAVETGFKFQDIIFLVTIKVF